MSSVRKYRRRQRIVSDLERSVQQLDETVKQMGFGTFSPGRHGVTYFKIWTVPASCVETEVLSDFDAVFYAHTFFDMHFCYFELVFYARDFELHLRLNSASLEIWVVR